MDELVKRLRYAADTEAKNHPTWNELMEQAADAIENLSEDYERAKGWADMWEEEANIALGKLQQYALTVANQKRQAEQAADVIEDLENRLNLWRQGKIKTEDDRG